MGRAESRVQVDNETTRVTRWRFAPGESTGWHRHEHDYVVVPITGGRLRLTTAEGTREVELEPGGAYFRTAGVEHDVENAGGRELAFVEVEWKAARG